MDIAWLCACFYTPVSNGCGGNRRIHSFEGVSTYLCIYSVSVSFTVFSRTKQDKEMDFNCLLYFSYMSFWSICYWVFLPPYILLVKLNTWINLVTHLGRPEGHLIPEQYKWDWEVHFENVYSENAFGQILLLFNLMETISRDTFVFSIMWAYCCVLPQL